MDKRKKILSGVGSVAILIAIYFLYEHFMYVVTDNAQVDAHVVMLAAKVGGYIAQVDVVEGQKVKRDEVLIQIDDRDYKNTLAQVSGELTSIEARMTDAEKNFHRLSSLYKNGAVSQQQFDAASASYLEVKSKYLAIEAQVSQAKLNLENTQIRAPMDGFVARKSAEKGQLAAPGIALIGFVGSDQRWVTANFKETEIDAIHIGSKVDIDIDAIGNKSFTGIVESLSAATGATFSLLPPDNATGNFTKVVQRVPVKIKMENLSEADISLLRAGLSAVVKVHKH
jgi:membrane fusion protein (multidrug efflux system)